MNIGNRYGKEQQQLKTTTLYLQFKETLFVIEIIKDNVIKTIQQGNKNSLSIIIFVLSVGYIFILLSYLIKTDIPLQKNVMHCKKIAKYTDVCAF